MSYEVFLIGDRFLGCEGKNDDHFGRVNFLRVAIAFCGDEIGGGDHFGRVNFWGVAIAFYLWVRGDRTMISIN